jgi:hypothetical protein
LVLMKFILSYMYRGLLYAFWNLRWAWLIGLLSCSEEKPNQFDELTPEQTGVTFRNDIVETQHNNILTYEYSYNGGGVAAGDLNNDGLADLYFVGNSVPNKLFLNRGDWQFEDVTDASGTSGRSDWCTGVSLADVNGDGWLDIYVCYSGNAPGEGYNLPVVRDYPGRINELFINNGGEPGGIPTFTESAAEYGLDAQGTFSTQGYFFDYDRDGDLDMFLLNHANMFYSAFFNTSRLRNLRHPYFGNRLYRNDGGKFVEVSEAARIHGSGLNFGLSAAISDLNHDDWPDIYVTNDYEEQDFCYINNGDGTFKEVSHKLFGHLSKFGMGSDIADLNNDGLQDIIVLDMLPEDNHRQKLLKGPDEYDRYMLAVDSGYHHQYMRNTLQLNRGFASDGLPRFSEIGQFSGISNTDWSWAPLAADFDNDGLRDIFAGNGYLRDYNNMDFIKYTGAVYEAARNARAEVDYVKLIQELPSTDLANYVFKNEDGLKFTNVTETWGFTSKAVTNGAAYADFDNDGDLDLVTNNLNGQAGLFRNNNEKLRTNHYVKVRLVGKSPNSFGVGTKVWVRAGERTLFHEAYPQRGYLSSVDPVLTIGLGDSETIDELRVVWPDGTESVESHLSSDQVIIVDAAKGKPSDEHLAAPNPTLIRDVTMESGIDFVHKENAFVDYKTQRLLFAQLSRLGGMLSVGDVNQDGNDDVFFGGASGQPGALFLGSEDGAFQRAGSVVEADAASEDMGSVFFDADGDGDVDLYVVSGGGEHEARSVLYQDRLYLNRGDGTFDRAVDALPPEASSGSCVATADFDKDGDIDLFVGGRHVPFSYGLIPRSYLLRNDSDENGVRFTDIAGTTNKGLANPGMVTSALWTDYNSDSWPDLIIAGEWMPILIFENQKGTLVERDFPGLRNSNGWWTTIFPADVDDDGDVDYLVGNAGTNLQFKASLEEPVQLFAGDFNDDGTLDPILCYYIQGKSYPMASRDELLDQMTSLRKKFITYADYADATIHDIAPAALLEKAYRRDAYRLESVWIENKGSDFEVHLLPDVAQFSAINGFLFDDFDGDGAREILAAGNFFPYKPQLGRCDASTGVVLTYDGRAGFTCAVQANVWLTGDIRGMALVRCSNGTRRVIVSRNDDHAGVFAVNRSVEKTARK